MKTQLISALVAGIAMTLGAQVSAQRAARVAVDAAPGLSAGAPYIIYLGDLDGTPREILSVGQVPAAGERRLRLPQVDRPVGMFLAVADSIFEIRADDRDRGRAAGLDSDVQVGKKPQWNIGRLDHYIQGQAPKASSGAVLGHVSLPDDPPADDRPFATPMEKKPLWTVGRLDHFIQGQAPKAAAGAVLGSGKVDMGTSDQAGDMGLQGERGRDVIVITCPWGGPAMPAAETTGQGTLGHGGTLANGLQGHELVGDAAIAGTGGRDRDGSRRDRRRNNGMLGSRGAVEIVNYAPTAGADAVLGGQVTVVISQQGLALLD